MEDWQTITEDELKERVGEEETRLNILSSHLLAQYENAKCLSFNRARIVRSKEYGEESIFVLARLGDHVLFFDDDEDEFAVGTIDDENTIQDWSLYGDLVDAIRGFIMHHKTA